MTGLHVIALRGQPHCKAVAELLQSRCSRTAKLLQRHCKPVAAILQTWLQRHCKIDAVPLQRHFTDTQIFAKDNRKKGYLSCFDTPP